MENRAKFKARSGQSVAEYAVVLALIFIVAVTVLLGVGQRSRARLANVDTVLGGHAGPVPASVAGNAGASADTSGQDTKDDQSSNEGSGTNQSHGASAEKD